MFGFAGCEDSVVLGGRGIEWAERAATAENALRLGAVASDGRCEEESDFDIVCLEAMAIERL